MAGDQGRSVVLISVLKLQVSPTLGKKKRNRQSSGKLATSFLLLNCTQILLFLQLQFPSDPEEVRTRTRQLDGLQIALRTQPNSFVTRLVGKHPEFDV